MPVLEFLCQFTLAFYDHLYKKSKCKRNVHSVGGGESNALCRAVGIVLYIRKSETKIVFLSSMKKGRLLCCSIIT